MAFEVSMQHMSQHDLKECTAECVTSGFGGLEVSVLAFGTQVRRFKPG